MRMQATRADLGRLTEHGAAGDTKDWRRGRSGAHGPLLTSGRCRARWTDLGRRPPWMWRGGSRRLALAVVRSETGERGDRLWRRAGRARAAGPGRGGDQDRADPGARWSSLCLVLQDRLGRRGLTGLRSSAAIIPSSRASRSCMAATRSGSAETFELLDERGALPESGPRYAPPAGVSRARAGSDTGTRRRAGRCERAIRTAIDRRADFGRSANGAREAKRTRAGSSNPHAVAGRASSARATACSDPPGLERPTASTARPASRASRSRWQTAASVGHDKAFPDRR